MCFDKRKKDTPLWQLESQVHLGERKQLRNESCNLSATLPSPVQRRSNATADRHSILLSMATRQVALLTILGGYLTVLTVAILFLLLAHAAVQDQGWREMNEEKEGEE